MSIYNKDELEHPSWIDRRFFERVLKEYEKSESININDVDVTPASMKGDHYASIMFRCKVSYIVKGSTKKLSLIIKTMPSEDGHKRDILKESELFETEISMYTEALPRIEKILAAGGEPTKLAAKIIYHSLEPYKVIVFEDLCESGYNVLRDRYLTEDEIKLIYCKLAKLHAASYILGHSAEHECVTQYNVGLFCSSVLMSMNLMADGIGHFIKMLEQRDEFKMYVDKVKAMQPEIRQRCEELYNAYKLNKGQDDIFVLNHGDFHMKNLMFKFDSKNNMEDVIMVDYQISCYAPSNIDLIYSQYLLLSPELRLKQNELAQYYFEEFTSMLKKLNYQGDMPRYSDFQISSLKYRHFSLFLLSTFLPMVFTFLVPPPDELQETEISEYIQDTEMFATTFYKTEFLEELRRLLPRLLFDGYLD